MTDRKTCPYCGEEIAASAKKCRFCGEWLDKDAEQEAKSQHTAEKPQGEDIANVHNEQVHKQAETEPANNVSVNMRQANNNISLEEGIKQAKEKFPDEIDFDVTKFKYFFFPTRGVLHITADEFRFEHKGIFLKNKDDLTWKIADITGYENDPLCCSLNVKLNYEETGLLQNILKRKKIREELEERRRVILGDRYQPAYVKTSFKSSLITIVVFLILLGLYGLFDYSISHQSNDEVNETEQVTDSTENATDSTEEDEGAFVSTAQMKEADDEVFIEDFYNDYVFANKNGNELEEVCSQSVLKRLRDAYEYDDGGTYRIAEFRTNAQDGCEHQQTGETSDKNHIIDIKSEGDGWYKVRYCDMGWIGETSIKVGGDRESPKIVDYRRDITDPEKCIHEQ